MKVSMSEQWRSIIDEFEHMYPEIADSVIDWYPSARYEITMKLENESRIVYNWWMKQYRYIHVTNTGSSQNDLSEEEWRIKFAHRMNTKMMQFGMSRSDLSELTGISPVTLSKYSNAKSTPTGNNIRRIAQALRCSPSELMDF